MLDTSFWFSCGGDTGDGGCYCPFAPHPCHTHTYTSMTCRVPTMACTPQTPCHLTLGGGLTMENLDVRQKEGQFVILIPPGSSRPPHVLSSVCAPLWPEHALGSHLLCHQLPLHSFSSGHCFLFLLVWVLQPVLLVSLAHPSPMEMVPLLKSL